MRSERRIMRRAAWALACTAFCVTGLSYGRGAFAEGPPTGRPGLIWIIGVRSLERLGAVPGSGPLVAKFFTGRNSILVGHPQGGPRALLARKSRSFASYQSLKRDLAAMPASRDGSFVILDLERWPQTPSREQANPARYYRLAAKIARSRGLKLVATPSSNLVPPWRTRLVPPFTSYLMSGVVAQVARSADIFEVQAQGFERSTALYREFVAAAADQARDANSHVTVIAGLSTNPGGRGVPATQLYRDMVAVRPYVDGFWLNIPKRSWACPRCGVPRPKIAAELLRRLVRDGAFLPSAPAPIAARA